MELDRAIEIFKKTGVMLEGHFLLTSGRHSNRYMQCARLFEYPEYCELMCKDLAERFRGEAIDLVIGPALGGVIMSYEVGRQLGVRNFFAERSDDGTMVLRAASSSLRGLAFCWWRTQSPPAARSRKSSPW